MSIIGGKGSSSSMNQLSDITKPGLMISQAWPNSPESEGETLRVLETALETEFFQAFQTVQVPYPAERQRIARIVEEKGLVMTYCFARVLNKKNLNLSARNEELRKASVREIISRLDEAREMRATFIALISGPSPGGQVERKEALLRLRESVAAICEAAAVEPKLTVVLEPLDIKAHKKGTLGFTKEAADLVREVRKTCKNIGLCLDTAHMNLNGEDPIQSLQLAQEYVVEFHFCNCVVDPGKPLYGDFHIPFGPPGILDVRGMAHILAEGHKMGFFTERIRPGVFCEVLNKSDDLVGNIRYCQESLQKAWEIFRAQLEG